MQRRIAFANRPTRCGANALTFIPAASAILSIRRRAELLGKGKQDMATTTIASAAVGPPLTSSERWTKESATVLAVCMLGFAFDIYEQTIVQIVTPILIKEWGITPATMGNVTTIARWIGLLGA